MPMRGELPDAAVRRYVQAPPAPATGWSRIAAVISNRELQAVVMFCAIGFLATVNVVVRFPEFGATVAQLAIFP